MKKYIVILILILNLGIYGVDDNCYTIIAGKNLTSGGSVLIAHNEDDSGKNFFVNVHKLPKNYRTSEKFLKLRNGGMYPATESNAFLWLEIPGIDFADSYVNEHGLVIVSNACPSREDKGILTEGGIGYFLRRIIAEKAKSAREAVVLGGKLIEKYGYYSSGRSYAFADSNEGWLLQVVKGKHWIAQRVPDDQIAIVPNYYTIREINLNDKKNFLGSKDIIKYAIKRGWYNPETDGAFNFSRTYSSTRALSGEYNRLRHWRGISLLSKLKLEPDDPLPFSFKPLGKIKISDLFMVLRDHYEGTPYDLTEKYKNGSPNFTKKRTICTGSTQYSIVADLRNNMPEEIAYQIWISFRRPDSNSFSIWYPSIHSTPNNYTRGKSFSAHLSHFKKDDSYYKMSRKYPFWNYAKLSDKVDKDYKKNIKRVKKSWKNFENFLLKNIRKREKEFKYILGKDKILGRSLITNYVHLMEYRRWMNSIDLLNSIH
ncbi:MAG: C69 family dipeptidase [Acidobacteriota bacterium]